MKWIIMESLQDNKKVEQGSRLKFVYRKYMPTVIKTFLRNLYLLTVKTTAHSEELGEINPQYFKEFKE